MKVLQAVHSFPPSQGGVEHHAYHLSKELSDIGNDVVVVTVRERGAKPEEKMAGIRIRRFYSLDFSLFASARFPFTSFFAMLDEDADVYASHTYGSVMPLFASVAALIKRKPFVFTLHGYPDFKGRKRFFHHIYKCLIAPVFLKIARKVIVVSKEGAEKMAKETDPAKIVYIPNGIEGRFDCEINYEKKNKLLYVGRLSEDKGLDVLMKAYAKIKEKYPDLTLKLVGSDDGEKNKLEELARSLDIHPMFSTVPYEKMPSIYADSKAVILPSRYEGLSLVWLESMSSGRPIFSTPVGEANSLFEQAYDTNKDRFLFRDENELAEKLAQFLENEEEYKKIVEKAKYIIKDEYSWKNVASQTRAVYEELV